MRGISERVGARPAGPINALCVDADDLAGSNAEAGIGVRNWRYSADIETHALLAELDQLAVKATFFIPGLFVARAPQLVRIIAERGHQIASHGTRHCHVWRLTRSEFRDDVRESKSSLEDLSGAEVDTYKAPMWSITPECVWAYDVLQESNFRVDHSAMPRLKKKLGFSASRLEPFVYSDDLVVIPVTTARLMGSVVPFPGGFYNAYVPFWVHRKIYGQMNRLGLPFNFYFHPYEHSPSPDNRTFIKYGSLFISLYAFHVGHYKSLLRRVTARYRLGTLREAYARWLGSPA